jgi:hypothetical protein
MRVLGDTRVRGFMKYMDPEFLGNMAIGVNY